MWWQEWSDAFDSFVSDFVSHFQSFGYTDPETWREMARDLIDCHYDVVVWYAPFLQGADAEPEQLDNPQEGA